MHCHELAHRIESLQPQAAARDVARLCLLLTNTTENVDQLEDEQRLTQVWREVNLRIQAAADQHAAMTEELENLARSDPKKFTPAQIWVLIRAIKVQSQIIQMYIGEEALSV
jgi:seryl-tRNA synthetase